MIPLLLGATLLPPAPGARPNATPRATPIKSEAPVTRAEAKRALDRVRATVDGALRLRAETFVVPLPSDATAVSAAEIVTILRRLTLRYESSFRSTPPVPPPATPERRFAAYRMIAPRGPLAIGRKALRPAEFGDAIGYFLVRIADLTHTARRDYSPQLMGGD